jgi:signal transduction histidine kinase
LRPDPLARVRPYLLPPGGLVVAAALTLGVAAAVLKVPLKDLELLALFLTFSGAPSLLLALAGLAVARRRRVGLGIKLAAGYALGVVVVVINVVVTAVLMFLSSHDLGVLGLLLLFAGMLSILFGALVGRSLAASIADLTAAARRMAAGDLSARVSIPPGDEIGELGAAFNRMAAQLEEYAARQREGEAARRELIAAVSHDLRTPLASIQAMVEALCDGVVADPEGVARYHRTIRSETAWLNLLITDLFELSRIEAGALRLDREPTSLHDLVSDTLRSLSPRAEQNGVILGGDVASDLPPIPIDAARIQRVLVNLVDNALRHTAPGGSVTITAGDRGDAIQVDVADTGEGIDPADVPHVFERFFRGEKSRSRDGAGAGLGLAIARGIVEAHGGKIQVRSTRGRGSTFSLTLPY